MSRTLLWLAEATLIVCLVPIVHAAPPASRPDRNEPGKLELSGAEHRLKLFEDKVQRARGQPMKLGDDEQGALDRIKALKEKYPAHEGVESLFQRARKALLASKGQTQELGPDVLAYRQNEKKLQTMFLNVATSQWDDYRAQLTKTEKLVDKPFPVPSHKDGAIDEMVGKVIVLDDFEYPTNQFADLGREFVFVGGGTKGYYFVDLSGRAWLGAYEAVKRYRRFINQDVPEGGRWTLVGRITGLDLLVPQAEKDKTAPAQWGWTVSPMAIWVPDRTLAVINPHLERGGSFAGEDTMEDIKGALYSVRQVPADVTPERLTQIFITAIKEKNYPLYLECIDPERRKTPKGMSLCMYHWEWHQKRFATFYCKVDIGEATTRVLQGLDMGDGNVESFFLTEEEKAKIAKHAPPLVEQGELRTTAFDERGRQYGSPKPRFLKRVDKGRWYITDYAQPF